MNILIVDFDVWNFDTAVKFYEKCCEADNSVGWIMLPKGMDLMQNVSIDWMKMVRDRLDEKIREIEG